MELLYSDNFGIHQWFLSKTGNPCRCIQDERVDLLYSGNFRIHQWLLSKIGNVNPVVVLEMDLLNSGTFGIHQWFFVESETLWLYSRSKGGFTLLDNFGIHEWSLRRIGNRIVVVFKIPEWVYFTLITLVSISGF